MATTSQPILALRDVGRRFGNLNAVDRVNLDIADGEFFTIVGPSGSGKTTLLRMLAGFEMPSSGEISLRGKRLNEVPCNKRPTSMVFQSLALFNHMSVGRNIEYSQKIKRVPSRERRARCLELLDVVRLPKDYYDKPVTLCSGGERQRVALARALASDPEILFFDEPLSAIDFRLRKILEKELKDLQRATGKTFVYITHSLEEAMVMSDRIGIMNAGNIVQVGTPAEIYNQPISRFVAEFMGEVNVFDVTAGAEPGRYASDAGHAIKGPSAPSGSARKGYIVVRPERMQFVDRPDGADNRLQGTILNEYSLGSRSQYHVRSGDKVLLVEGAGGRKSASGSNVTVGWNAQDSIFVLE